MNRHTLAFADDDNSPFLALADVRERAPDEDVPSPAEGAGTRLRVLDPGTDGVRSLNLRPRRDHTCARRGAEGAAS